MILTGDEIEREWRNGRITIDPFIPEQVNPNSYNFRLGRTLRVYKPGVLDVRTPNAHEEIEIPDHGYVLEPGRLYLAHTIEVLGSDSYAPTFSARSSIARLGIFINLSASLGDIGYKGEWTLQLFTMHRVRVYAGINIGQMMWWRPAGDIVLYQGKYQGAVGPRSSDIHVDFDKQIARQRLPSLRGSVSGSQTGGKFAALAECSRDLPVPAAFCVPAGEFLTSLTAEQAAALADAFADLRATVGAFVTEGAERIAAVAAGVRLPDQLRRLITLRLTELFGDPPGGPLAVRSSGLAEDTATASLAGVHDTVLGVRGTGQVLDAIERCWRSYYALPAVAARTRTGDTSWQPKLAVIVQEQVQPRLAGVAFTTGGPDREVVLEYVAGLADAMVAGVEVPVRVSSDALGADQPELAAVVSMVRTLRHRYQHELDVEWAVDGRGPQLLQVRPQTARPAAAADHAGPLLEIFPLYTEDLPAGTPLGDVAAVYSGYLAKRGPAYRLAARHRVATGPGWVVRCNGRGLYHPATADRLRDRLAEGPADHCVLDLADTLRQIVVPKPEVVTRLAELTSAAPAGTRTHTAVVRDFLHGELGMISRLAGPGLVVEYAPEGLLALNRGTAGAERVVVADLDRPLSDPDNLTAPAGRHAGLVRAHLAGIGAFTRTARAELGEVTLEWVYAAGRPHLVDYSRLGADQVTVGPARPGSGTVPVSGGTARGRLVKLTEDELLSRLSIGPAVSIDRAADVSGHEALARIIDRISSLPEPPVVYARRPYAVLSVLIGKVAGFVFERGSTLGHLPILLREAGIPAVAYPEPLPDGCETVLSDGTLSYQTASLQEST